MGLRWQVTISGLCQSPTNCLPTPVQVLVGIHDNAQRPHSPGLQPDRDALQQGLKSPRVALTWALTNRGLNGERFRNLMLLAEGRDNVKVVFAFYQELGCIWRR